jgi:peptidylprolyl isomerase
MLVLSRARLMLVVGLLLWLPGCGGENVVKSDTGLKYVDVKEGEGPAAKVGDTVEVFYTGWLKDGKQFDTNVGKEPLSVNIGRTQVIMAWTEGLVGMKAGGKRRLIVPPNLGYGEAGDPPEIPRNAELFFDIEVVKIK